MKKSILLFGMIFGMVISFNNSVYASDIVYDGIKADTLDVSNLNKVQLEKKLNNYSKELLNKSILFNNDGKLKKVKLKNLNLEIDEKKESDKILNLGRNGNLIERYKNITDFKNDGYVYNINKKFDESLLNKEVVNLTEFFSTKVQNATVKKIDGNFNIVKEKNGITVDKNKLKNEIIEKLNSDMLDLEIDVSDMITVKKPKYTYKDFDGIDNLKATYSTNYNGSVPSRANNIVVGARHINGKVVYPNEVVSVTKMLAPFTISNGYNSASIYSNGRIDSGIGGGVCQVSTTLYNALLRSELEIVERQNHSMRVHYVPAAFDAAIAEGYKDLKFKNNTKYPIYLEGYTTGNTLTFNVYGKDVDKNKNRKIEFISNVLSVKAPNTVKELDKSKPKGYTAVKQNGDNGMYAQMIKVVYENGKEVSREIVNSSNYKPLDKIVIVGDRKEEPKKEKDNPKKEDTVETKKENVIGDKEPKENIKIEKQEEELVENDNSDD